MAENRPTPETPAEKTEAGAASGGGLMTKLKAFGLVSAVVLAECGLALVMFPSAEDATAMAQAKLALAAVDNPGS